MSAAETKPMRDDFDTWLISPVIRVSLSRRHEQWYAVADEFGIAGVGQSQADAYRDVAGLVDAYLRSCFAEGQSYDEAMRSRQHPQRSAPSIVRTLTELARTVVDRLAPRKSVVVLPSTLHRAGPS